MMRIVLFLLIYFPFELSAQNLLVNGSFEDENVCTEFDMNCAPEGWINSAGKIDEYVLKNSKAYTGSHYVMVAAGIKNALTDRTYIRSQLLCHPRKGKSYRIELYLKSRFNLLDSIGIYFTPHDFFFEKGSPNLLKPSMYVMDGESHLLANDTTWQKVSLLYIATGEESFITIGNFSQRSSHLIDTRTLKSKEVFIMIDEVSMIPDDPIEKLCEDWEIRKDEIYDFNVRHHYLNRYIKTHTADIPEKLSMSLTFQKQIDTLILPEILFETGKSHLTLECTRFLDSVITILQKKNIDSVVVEGHTDNIGTALNNAQLSIDRSAVVGKYLGNKFRRSSYIMRGWGSEKPIAGNESKEGRQKNRRVMIYLHHSQ